MSRPAAPDSAAHPLQLLIIADGKPGHENQSSGLAQAIARHRPVHITRVSPVTPAEALQGWLFRRLPDAWHDITEPDLIISTGSRTHLSLVAAGRIFSGAFTVLLCSSSLPSRLFDLNVVPEHDSHRPGRNIVFTKGVLNKVTPSETSQPGYGLMLIGGESKHYHWDNDELIRQMAAVVAQTPETSWHLTNSRRTPENLANRIQQDLPTVTFHPWQETPAGWLPEQLVDAEKIWVTPDSVSMVYESLTSGNRVYLFNLKSRKTRVSRGIEALQGHQTGYLRDDIIVEPEVTQPLREADRIARIVLERIA